MSEIDDSEGAGDLAGARAAVRFGADYLLRSLHMLGELSDGELLTGLISMAIVQANIAHLTQAKDQAGAFPDVERVPPDEMRRPVSIMALANGLGLPYETTRRHVEKMVARGQCVRLKGGVVVPTAALDSDRHRAFVTANLANLRRLFRELRRAGVRLE